MPRESLSLRQARRVALAAQGFGRPPLQAPASWAQVRRAIHAIGLLQLDSVSALVRSHYLPVFSRLGPYDRDALDARAFRRRGRQFFEYWGHEASLLPLETWPLFRWRMERAARHQGMWTGVARFAQENPAYIAAVRDEVRRRGPLSARELDDPGTRSGQWWGWHKGKAGLEWLFWAGEITAVERRGFERVYDLTERVIPARILAQPAASKGEAHRALAAIAARALGIATAADIRDYFRLLPEATRTAIAELVEAGELIPVEVEGWRPQAFLHAAARLPRRISASALVSPFDPLIWERGRTQRLFDFHYRIEIYTPAEKRKFGYYVMPYLMDDRLVARVDLKADRKAAVLVASPHCEDWCEEDRAAEGIGRELRRLAAWLGLGEMRIIGSDAFSRAVAAEAGADAWRAAVPA
jgi:uncharacterized protein YcaQ